MEERTGNATARQTAPDRSEITQADSDPPQQHSSSSQSHVIQLPINQTHPFQPSDQNETTSVSENTLPRFSFSVLSSWILLIIAILILLLFIIAIVFYLALKPKSPNFSVDNLIISYPQSQSQISPSLHLVVYNLSMETQNPNSHVSIYYLDGGYASLSYQKQEIAIGKPSPFFHHPKRRYHFYILLNSKGVLPKEIEESMKGEKAKEVEEIPVALLIHVPVKMEFWSLKIWKMTMEIKCDVNISIGAKKSGLGSQHCTNKVWYK
ncbi:hypothetical protein L6164_032575 [Bauhinia variegata]|uniref:Uncharacterized protein n=1 Tax=Bauhinia variegata TaxID=167791 RepID=A0ACB9KPX3_BAUVA|nr:hypothetical protein L6164_032575 [Bauhinia variegata]